MANDVAIVGQLSYVKTPRENVKLIAKFIHASFIFNSPVASGLDLVLSTLLSKSLSHISFTIQPADLIVNAPTPNTPL